MALYRSSQNLWVGLGCILSAPCTGERVQPAARRAGRQDKGPSLLGREELRSCRACSPAHRETWVWGPLLAFLGANVWGEGIVHLASVGLVPFMRHGPALWRTLFQDKDRDKFLNSKVIGIIIILKEC